MRKWINLCFKENLDAIERQALEAVVMKTTGMKCVKVDNIKISTLDLQKAGIRMDFHELCLTFWALFSETVILPDMSGGYRFLSSMFIDKERREIVVSPSRYLMEMRQSMFATISENPAPKENEPADGEEEATEAA